MPKNEPTKKELQAKIQDQEQLLVKAGVKKPDTLIGQIEEIEDEYRDKIWKLAQECANKTGRPLSFYPLITYSGITSTSLF